MPSADPLRDTTAFLHRAIPITAAMGIRVTEASATQLVLEAPLAQNYNHLGTAFGGSLATIATLAGYALLWIEMRDPSAHVVIRESRMNYRRPVRGDLRAICPVPDAATLATFHEALARKGKARITLDVIIEENGQTAVEFSGTFVAIR
jgi:thioesterase domain-containing protein